METAKWITLDMSDSQILGVKVYRIGQGPVRTFKIEIESLICTKRY